MLPWNYGFVWNEGHIVFLGAFYTVLLAIAATLAVAAVRSRRALLARQAEAIRWHGDFESLPACDQACRHVLTGEFRERQCPHAFDCRECETHKMLLASHPLPLVKETEEDVCGLVFPLDRFYHRGHTWARLEKDGTVLVGLDELGARLEARDGREDPVVAITFDDGYKNMYAKLLPIVRDYGYPITLFVYTDFIREKSTKALTWSELREMQQNGIDIQSHSISHPDLVKIAAKDTPESREKLYREFYLSRKLIELKMGKPVDLFAFPFGYYDTKTIQCASLAGYRRVFSTDEGANPVSRNNYCLRRHHIIKNYPLNKIIKIID